MKQLIIIIGACLSLISCTSKSGQRLKSLKKVAVQEIFLTSDDLTWVAFHDVQVKWVDTMYHLRDTVVIDSKYYVIRRD
jgi:hypothetical protein